MDSNDLGRSPDGSGSRASHEAATASSPEASIPDAACRDAQRNLGIVHFTKLPVTIEAARVNAADYNGHTFDGCPFDAVPQWLQDAFLSGVIKADTPRCTDYAEWKIETREGAVWAGPDDWIVRGIEGEIYPCAGNIFERTYAPDASAIEARRAATTGAVHESAIGNAETPKPSRGTDHG